MVGCIQKDKNIYAPRKGRVSRKARETERLKERRKVFEEGIFLYRLGQEEKRSKRLLKEREGAV